MVNTMARNARDMGSILTLGAIFAISISSTGDVVNMFSITWWLLCAKLPLREGNQPVLGNYGTVVLTQHRAVSTRTLHGTHSLTECSAVVFYALCTSKVLSGLCLFVTLYSNHLKPCLYGVGG